MFSLVTGTNLGTITEGDGGGDFSASVKPVKSNHLSNLQQGAKQTGQ